MVDDLNKNETLANLRLTAACLLAFAGFLRFNELVNICCCDVSIGVDMLKICIPQSKTDQLRKGDEVVISRSSAPTCPVKMLERYIHMAKIDKMDTELFLFRPLIKSKKGECLRAGGLLGYSTLWELFKKKMRDLGYPTENLGIHSLQAGGATAAAMLVCQIGCLKGMVDGGRRMPKMAMLKIPWRKGYRSPANLAYNGNWETASGVVESLYLLYTLVISIQFIIW